VTSPNEHRSPVRLSEIPRALENRFGPVEHELHPGEGKHASVALILRPPAAGAGRDPHALDTELLVIRRAVQDRDPWSGHMALPGGRVQVEDRDLVATAVRETMEETAVHLGTGALGRVDVMRPAGRGLPPITIWPFVFKVDPSTPARVNSPREVDRVYWLRLAELTAERNRSVHRVTRDGTSFRFPCIRVEGEIIWGITYRILEGFLAVL